MIDQVKNKEMGGIAVRYDYKHILDDGYSEIDQKGLKNESTMIFTLNLAPQAMIEYIRERPAEFPVISSILTAAEGYVSVVDRVILPGGADIDPRFYGEVAGPKTRCGAIERDWFELALLSACERVEKSVLGICRGMQMLHIWAGGKLIQHCEGYEGQILQVNVEGRQESVYGFFHQVPAGATPGFETVAKTQARDGVEIPLMIRGCGNWDVLGVLFHPECKREGLPAGAMSDFAAALSPYNLEIIRSFMRRRVG